MPEDSTEPTFTLGEPRRMWESTDPPRMRVWVPFRGCATVLALKHLADELGIPYQDLGVNHPQSVSWIEPATHDDCAARAARELDRDLRHAKWERDTYERLRAKFEADRKGTP